jgi:hypothetical protein
MEERQHTVLLLDAQAFRPNYRVLDGEVCDEGEAGRARQQGCGGGGCWVSCLRCEAVDKKKTSETLVLLFGTTSQAFDSLGVAWVRERVMMAAAGMMRISSWQDGGSGGGGGRRK